MTSAAAPSPDARHHRSTAAGDRSGNSSGSAAEFDRDTDDDEVEYEEIEEEIEVEEEVEEEVEVEEEEEVEDKELNEEEVNAEGESEDRSIDRDRKDVSKDMESKGQEEHLRSGSSDPEISVPNLRSDIIAVEGGIGNTKFSCASEARQKGESRVDVGDPKYRKSGFRGSAGDKKDVVAFPERGTPKDYDACNAIELSLCDSGIKTAEITRPLSVSGKEVDGAISIRDEFSKADVVVSLEADIKKSGTQSREDINQEPTRLVVPQIRLRSLTPVAESDNGSKRPAVICDFFAKGWCIKGSSCRFLHVKDHVNVSQEPGGDVAALTEKSELQAGGGERSRSPDFPNAIASSVAYSSSFSLDKTLSGEHGESPRRHHLRENHTIMSFRRDDLSHANPPDSLARSLFIPSDAHASLPTFGIFSSQNIEGLTRSSSFGCLDKDPLGAHKLPDSVKGYNASGSASSFQSSSPFSGSELGNLSHRRKLSSDDWEPSAPFRPSFLITQRLLAPGSLYDPIHDSIEQPILGDGFSKFSSKPETSITNSHLSIDSDPVLKRTLGSEDKLSNKMEFNHDPRIQEDGPRQKKEVKVEGSRNEIDIDLKIDEEQKDSKALKYFRAELVEFVKEVVKPKWREGQLSKDAHKLIVKKAVEKVLSTLQPHQTPSSAEAIKQYLSASKPKICKLVEGYVVKYGKL